MAFTTIITVSCRPLALAVMVVVSTVLWQARAPAAAQGVAVPEAATPLPADSESGSAVFAGGCFWGMESVFEHVAGVTDVVSGYAGGVEAHANYRDSSSGRYDDAEAVHITYDPAKISYGELLRIYFSVAHDPTQVDRQGPDIGTQYRSQVFAANVQQAWMARAYIRQLERAGVFSAPIATAVSTGERFFAAEPSHQNYAARNPDDPYIRINDVPKVEALQKRFADFYRQRPKRLVVNE